MEQQDINLLFEQQYKFDNNNNEILALDLLIKVSNI